MAHLQNHLSLALIFLILLTVHYEAYAEDFNTREGNQWVETKAPWALGLAFSDGTPLEGGYKLDWSKVSNITAIIKLPNITLVDNTIYLILTVMNSDEEVFQVAAGINPSEPIWLVYAFYIRNIAEYPQTYVWVANRTQPKMFPNDRISLALYRVQDEGWRYSAFNIRTGERATGLFPASNVHLRSGEQEVFALESYTSNPNVFKEMGEVVLEGVYIDGLRIEGEGYVLGGWDPSHKPLFLVGGGNPPSFIAVIRSTSQYKWVYSPVESWETSSTPIYIGLAYASTIVLVVVLATILIKRR